MLANMTKPKRGGTRPGAGAPPLHDKAMTKYTVLLDDATVAKARDIGSGNLSAGLREAVRNVKK